MSPAPRCVAPEVLDGLTADDPRARRARGDLRRIHVVMRSVTILRRAVARLGLATPPRRIVELGAGDGTLLLRLARTLKPRWDDVELTLLDQVDLVSDPTRQAYQELGWRVSVERADVLDWAARPPARRYDLCFANLFLHHFEPAALGRLLAGVATGSNALVACEPRRSAAALLGSRLVVFLGANAVTREDALKSVAAGFTDHELIAAWPAASGWRLDEYSALPFSHCLVAVRDRGGDR